MAAETPICNFGEPAKPFDLMGTDGKRYTLDDVRGPNGTLVMFICNHCPYVRRCSIASSVTSRDLKELGSGDRHQRQRLRANIPRTRFERT